VALSVVGVSHRTAPIELRERFHVDPKRLPELMGRTMAAPGVRECVILSTCNRTECYLYGAREAGPEAARTAMTRRAGVTRVDAERFLYLHEGREAATHLLRVTAGLDSLVIGEPQIQGQVSEAYRIARGSDEDRPGPVLHRLFQTALSAGGEVRAATRIGEGAASVPAAAVELAEKIFGTLEDRTAMVVGAGEMGRLTLRALLDRGIGGALVASRTFERASATASDLDPARPVSFEEFWDRLPRVDVVVTSTAAPHPLVTAERMHPVLRGRRDPLVIIDIALPRDVEPRVGELSGVFLYNIDDLQRVVQETRHLREEEGETAAVILGEHVEEFWRWLQAREAVPLIREVRERAERIRQEQMEEALGSIAGLEEEDRERIRVASRQLLNKVLHAPTVGLRRLAQEEGEEVLELARRLFDVDPHAAPGLELELEEAPAVGRAGRAGEGEEAVREEGGGG